MNHSLYYRVRGILPRGFCALSAGLSFVAFLPVLQSCTFARTSAKISETGARYLYADCSTLEKNVLFEKDGRYYVKARQRVCERKQDLWGTMAVALNYWGYRDVPLPDAEQPSGYVAVRIPRDMALRISGKQPHGARGGRGMRLLEAESIVAMPEIDLNGAQEKAMRYPLALQDDFHISMASCRNHVPDMYVQNGCETDALHAWMQPVAWLDALVVDVPLSVVATPVRWIWAGCRTMFRTP